VSDEGAVYYIAQEKAMAPGIVKEWPDIVRLPKDKNGRLKKISLRELEQQARIEGARLALEAAKKEISEEIDFYEFLYDKSKK
jgi:hypothetical protein